MAKRFFLNTAAFLCAAFMIFSFTACDFDLFKKGEEEHTHAFSEEWKSDAVSHWRECACGEKDSLASHSGGTATCLKKAECTVCKAEYGALASHLFEQDAWVEESSSNCSTAGVKGHKDCSVCLKHFAADGVTEIEELGIAVNSDHDFQSTWSKNESEHWHECKRNSLHKTDVGDHVWNNGVVTTPATWGTEGLKTFTCITCQKTKTEPIPKLESVKYTFPQSVSFGNDVYVHDPSIFKDPKSGTYYAFGTHYAVASSNDLIHWTQYAYDQEWAKLYGSAGYTKGEVTFPQVIRDCVDLIDVVTTGNNKVTSTWAPHVEFYNNKYYMYYSVTKEFGSNESVIARVESNNVLGPYSNNTILVHSKGADRDTEPNCIDPELFYDKEGKLWMVYGSFMGGVFIKELYNSGENWGLPKESGFGKLLWKGGLSGAEGPYIFRNGNYYYLMVSDGSLTSNYNMRIARSENPDGPYVDISGADMAAAYGNGNKLAGNWQFNGETGKAAYGHNSVCEINGEFFVIAHMRYDDGSGNVTLGHNVRVHRLLFNAEGWPVLASERYAGETLGAIAESELVGSYDLILHSEGMPASFTGSSRYTFSANHTVSGAQSGTWSFTPNGSYIEITLGGVTYKGVAIPVWTAGGGTFCLSAVSNTGRSLWANLAQPAVDPNLDIIKRTEGAANNINVASFDAASGFTVSFLSTVAGTNAGDDWGALALVCRGLEISLPNLRALAGNAAGVGTAQLDMYPSRGGNYNVGSGAWNSYLGTTCFVSIAIDGNGIRFYKNGACTQSYPVSAVIDGTVTVGSFVTAFLQGVTAEGFTFAQSGFTASNLIVSRGAVNDAKALAIYNYYA